MLERIKLFLYLFYFNKKNEFCIYTQIDKNELLNSKSIYKIKTFNFFRIYYLYKKINHETKKNNDELTYIIIFKYHA